MYFYVYVCKSAHAVSAGGRGAFGVCTNVCESMPESDLANAPACECECVHLCEWVQVLVGASAYDYEWVHLCEWGASVRVCKYKCMRV